MCSDEGESRRLSNDKALSRSPDGVIQVNRESEYQKLREALGYSPDKVLNMKDGLDVERIVSFWL